MRPFFPLPIRCRRWVDVQIPLPDDPTKSHQVFDINDDHGARVRLAQTGAQFSLLSGRDQLDASTAATVRNRARW